MILTKVNLDYRCESIREAVNDCQKMHQIVSLLFGINRKEGNVLYRLRMDRDETSLYIYSDEPVEKARFCKIDGARFAGEQDISYWLSSMKKGKIVHFDLLTMPFKKVKQENGYSQRRVLREKEDRIEWIYRKANQNGFRILNVEELGQQHFSGYREESEWMYWDAYIYQGMLCIENETDFQKAIRCGIGAGKAYGLGMLMLV